MIKYIDSKKMGRSHLSWLDSHFHFSFAEYHNTQNINFGVLRVINDDLISPHTGFDTHSHKDMEIISYIVDGEITHADSMDNKKTLIRGQVQYMSAGTGITHSEHNRGDDMLRILQIWIYPDKAGYTPNYGDYKFNIEDRQDRWLPIATDFNNNISEAKIRIHSDVNVYATIISKGNSLDFEVLKGRQAYLVLIEGEAVVGNVHMNMRDALEITEENINILSINEAHVLIIEMEASNE